MGSRRRPTDVATSEETAHCFLLLLLERGKTLGLESGNGRPRDVLECRVRGRRVVEPSDDPEKVIGFVALPKAGGGEADGDVVWGDFVF